MKDIDLSLGCSEYRIFPPDVAVLGVWGDGFLKSRYIEEVVEENTLASGYQMRTVLKRTGTITPDFLAV
jgi:hypothetical protein